MQNEFEKQMQRKMDELKIHPSEAVWQNVKAQIVKPKRRRRGMIILFFLLAGFVLGGYWLLQQDNQHKAAQSNNPILNQKDKSLTITENKKQNIDSTALPRLKQKDKSLTITENKKQNINSTALTHISRANILPNNGIVKAKSPSALPYKRSFVQPLNEINEDKSNKILNTEPINDNTVESNPLPKNSDNDELNKANTKEDSLTSPLAQNEVKLQNNVPGNPSKKVAVPLKKNDKWKFGILFSAGRSGIVNSFLSFNELLNFSEDKSALALDYLNSSPQTGGSNQGNNVIIPSKIQRSGAFITGVSAEKRISKKMSLSLGVNYKYFSTTNRVGEKNDTTRAFRVNNSGHKYRNGFNYIEAPAELKFQLWNTTVPVYLRGGFVISRLISSNSLQYNSITHTYFKDNSFFNKTQFGFTTGLYATLFSKEKNSLQIGPDFYFGATNLASSGLYNKKHFSYIGLRSQIIFGRK